MVRPVLRYPNPTLKRVAREVDPRGRSAEEVVRDLEDTMRDRPRCTGIAAPQIGELLRAIVIDVTDSPRTTTCHGALALINPEIVSGSGSKIGREGCLSIPDLTANVRRFESVVVRAHEPGGGERVVSTDGFEAVCLQHEIDHLDGILFLDRVESLTDDVFRRRRK